MEALTLEDFLEIILPVVPRTKEDVEDTLEVHVEEEGEWGQVEYKLFWNIP